MESPWADATLAAAMLAVDPAGLGGVVVRGHAGPVRDQWLALLTQLLPAGLPVRKIPTHVKEDRLIGGLDLTATLHLGRPVGQQGILVEVHGGLAILPMAERLAPSVAAHIAAAIDLGEVVVERDGVTMRGASHFGLVALDEGIGEDEVVPGALIDRMAILIDLTSVGLHDVFDHSFEIGSADPTAIEGVAQARLLLSQVEIAPAVIRALCSAAWALGIRSARVPILAARVARVAAALDGRLLAEQDDAVLAARLVLAPRALIAVGVPAQPPSEDAPEPPPDAPAEDAPPEPPPESDTADSADHDNEPALDATKPMDDVVLEAARAAIPPGLLAQLKAEGGMRVRGSAGRSGAVQKAGQRGRPAGTRHGEPGAGLRLSVVDTLRAAAPWQRLRRQAAMGTAGAGSGGQNPQRLRIEIRPEDFRVRRYIQRSETTTLFVVDASGSSALNRLAEAKGAVELLLADCYVRRDRVAVLGFRGQAAELLLSPTRSLVRAKRSLAGLPGGGGTPLASAIDQAVVLAGGIRRRGETPLLVFLTDAKANVARDGTQGRATAQRDAEESAKLLRSTGVRSMLIDTSPKPHLQARDLARDMGAQYLYLPYAGASSISAVVKAIGEQSRSTAPTR
jgi:magnesium chelatase subunit D